MILTTHLREILKKLEYYCAYQERCHEEVLSKLFQFSISPDEKDIIIVQLIQDNFLNEERFAKTFTISKFHQKKWGKIRIINELKTRKISNTLINVALKQIPNEEYFHTFEFLAEKQWELSNEKNTLKKRKKIGDYLLRKGWESNLVYEKLLSLEKEHNK